MAGGRLEAAAALNDSSDCLCTQHRAVVISFGIVGRDTGAAYTLSVRNKLSQNMAPLFLDNKLGGRNRRNYWLTALPVIHIL